MGRILFPVRGGTFSSKYFDSSDKILLSTFSFSSSLLLFITQKLMYMNSSHKHTPKGGGVGFFFLSKDFPEFEFFFGGGGVSQPHVVALSTCSRFNPTVYSPKRVIVVMDWHLREYDRQV